MSDGDKLLPKEYNVAAAIGANLLCKFDAAGLIVVATAAADNIIGVTGHAVTADQFTAGKIQMRVEHMGQQDVVAGAAILPGVPITADGSGRAIAAVATNNTAGFVKEEATALGDIIACIIVPAAR